MIKTKERKQLVLSLKDIDPYYKGMSDDLLLGFAEDWLKQTIKTSLKDYIENWLAEDQQQWEAQHCKDIEEFEF